KFEDIFSSVVEGLKKLLSIPEDYTIFFVSSGTEAMERTIENVVKKHSMHFVNGAFSKRFFETALELGKNAKKSEVKLGQGFDFTNLTDPVSKSVELLCFTHNETSTGVMLSADQIAKMKKSYPDTLIAVDIVSSAPYANIDFTQADIVFFSVQKGFGLPAGLGVMVVSPQAFEKATVLQKQNNYIGTYHNFPTLKKWADKNQTPETPSVFHLYLFSKVLQDMLKIGIRTMQRQTDEKAQLLYDFFDTHPTWKPFVSETKFRSPTVIVAEVGQDQKKLKEYLQKEHVIIGSGYGPNKDMQIRLANFPALSKKDIVKLIRLLHNYK
ncbi:MAG: alanine--glyoxylate aminotransferase family protein, partial [Patescibacteria group bacterium]|nr:alanine--glyoxylate aminotransferase family protein [Patescibacteria group bacterium]